MVRAVVFAAIAIWFSIIDASTLFVSAFQPLRVSSRNSVSVVNVPRTEAGTAASSTKLNLVPETQDSIQQLLANSLAADAPSSTTTTATATSLLLSSDTESWRQYVPLVVSCAVIIDILLGSPLANLALGPMRRASEKGATGDSSMQGNEDDGTGGGGGGSLFSALTGNVTPTNAVDRSKERVDSEAIAQAALDKAYGTLELKRFLEENKSDEQRYEEVRRKIDKQMEELED